MTIPREVANWLKDNNMRAISTAEYLELIAENMKLKKQVERVKRRCEAVLAR